MQYHGEYGIRPHTGTIDLITSQLNTPKIWNTGWNVPCDLPGRGFEQSYTRTLPSQYAHISCPLLSPSFFKIRGLVHDFAKLMHRLRKDVPTGKYNKITWGNSDLKQTNQASQTGFLSHCDNECFNAHHHEGHKATGNDCTYASCLFEACSEIKQAYIEHGVHREVR